MVDIYVNNLSLIMYKVINYRKYAKGILQLPTLLIIIGIDPKVAIMSSEILS